MAQDVSENDLLIDDMKSDLLRRIEESARLSGRSVEDEAAFLLERVGTGRPEDRAAARQDAAHRLDVQRHGVPFERPAPPIAEPDELKAVLLHALADHGADNCVQPGAVAAAGEDSHSHGNHLSGPEACADGCGASRR